MKAPIYKSCDTSEIGITYIWKCCVPTTDILFYHINIYIGLNIPSLQTYHIQFRSTGLPLIGQRCSFDRPLQEAISYRWCSGWRWPHNSKFSNTSHPSTLLAAIFVCFRCSGLAAVHYKKIWSCYLVPFLLIIRDILSGNQLFKLNSFY